MGKELHRRTKRRRASELHRRTKRRRASKWSQLPTDLLELILKKLPTVIDMKRFNAVCSLWSSAAKSYTSAPSYSPPQNPCIMFQIYRGRHEKQYSCLFDPAAKTVYKLKNVFKEFPYANCVGLWHGWLVFFDKSIIHLFNPLSKACIQLPEIRTPRHAVSKAIISSNPSNNKNFLVVVVVRGRLVFCRHKDKAWTALDDARRYDYDYEAVIMFHNYHLYALASNRSLDVWDCRESVPMKSMYVPGSAAGVTTIHHTYLVESAMGEILRVMKCDFQTRTQFFVEKLISTHQTWEKVEILGDQILFVFQNQAISLSNRSIAGCEENAVYDFVHDSQFSNYAGHGIGQYNLEGDGICKFKREYLMRSRNFFDCPDIYELRYCFDQKPFWIVPTC